MTHFIYYFKIGLDLELYWVNMVVLVTNIRMGYKKLQRRASLEEHMCGGRSRADETDTHCII